MWHTWSTDINLHTEIAMNPTLNLNYLLTQATKTLSMKWMSYAVPLVVENIVRKDTTENVKESKYISNQLLVYLYEVCV